MSKNLTSVVQTVWEDKATDLHEEFSGVTDKTGEAMATLQASGLSHDQALRYVDRIATSQAVTAATDHGWAAAQAR